MAETEKVQLFEPTSENSRNVPLIAFWDDKDVEYDEHGNMLGVYLDVQLDQSECVNSDGLPVNAYYNPSLSYRRGGQDRRYDSRVWYSKEAYDAIVSAGGGPVVCDGAGTDNQAYAVGFTADITSQWTADDSLYKESRDDWRGDDEHIYRRSYVIAPGVFPDDQLESLGIDKADYYSRHKLGESPHADASGEISQDALAMHRFASKVAEHMGFYKYWYDDGYKSLIDDVGKVGNITYDDSIPADERQQFRNGIQRMVSREGGYCPIDYGLMYDSEALEHQCLDHDGFMVVGKDGSVKVFAGDNETSLYDKLHTYLSTEALYRRHRDESEVVWYDSPERQRDIELNPVRPDLEEYRKDFEIRTKDFYRSCAEWRHSPCVELGEDKPREPFKSDRPSSRPRMKFDTMSSDVAFSFLEREGFVDQRNMDVTIPDALIPGNTELSSEAKAVSDFYTQVSLRGYMPKKAKQAYAEGKSFEITSDGVANVGEKVVEKAKSDEKAFDDVKFDSDGKSSVEKTAGDSTSKSVSKVKPRLVKRHEPKYLKDRRRQAESAEKSKAMLDNSHGVELKVRSRHGEPSLDTVASDPVPEPTAMVEYKQDQPLLAVWSDKDTVYDDKGNVKGVMVDFQVDQSGKTVEDAKAGKAYPDPSIRSAYGRSSEQKPKKTFCSKEMMDLLKDIGKTAVIGKMCGCSFTGTVALALATHAKEICEVCFPKNKNKALDGYGNADVYNQYAQIKPSVHETFTAKDLRNHMDVTAVASENTKESMRAKDLELERAFAAPVAQPALAAEASFGY